MLIWDGFGLSLDFWNPHTHKREWALKEHLQIYQSSLMPLRSGLWKTFGKVSIGIASTVPESSSQDCHRKVSFCRKKMPVRVLLMKSPVFPVEIPTFRQFLPLFSGRPWASEHVDVAAACSVAELPANQYQQLYARVGLREKSAGKGN